MATVGLIGLGRMGGNMARRWRQHGVNVIAFNRNHSVTETLAAECGVIAANSIAQLVQQLPAPRIVWLMLPAGAVTQQHIDSVLPLLSAGDVLVDGANSYFKDSLARAENIHNNSAVQYVDAGVSGGLMLRRSSAPPKARVEQQVKRIDDEIDRDDDSGEQHHHILDHDQIALGQSLKSKAA